MQLETYQVLNGLEKKRQKRWRWQLKDTISRRDNSGEKGGAKKSASTESLKEREGEEEGERGKRKEGIGWLTLTVLVILADGPGCSAE